MGPLFMILRGPFLFLLLQALFINTKHYHFPDRKFCLRIKKDVVIILHNPFKNSTNDRLIALFSNNDVQVYFALSNEAL